MKKEFCIESQEIGDIILVSNKVISSHFQRYGQTIYSRKYSRYSHAILALEKGIYIEAMKDNSTKNNVTIFCIDELKERLQKEYKDNWKIVRFKNINKDIQEKINHSAAYFYGQKYNSNPFYKKRYLKHNKNSSFCSELIQRIYEKSDIKIGKINQDIWPVHLDLLTKESKDKWEDITTQYNKKCTSLYNESFYVDLCKKSKSIRKYIFYANQEIANTIELTNLAKSFIETVINNLDNIEKYDKKSYDQLVKEYASKPTFYNQFIMPIESEYENIEYNKNNTLDLGTNSYVYENMSYDNFNINFNKYNELLLSMINLCNQIINFIEIYFNNLLNDKANTEFTKQLNKLLNSYPLYEEKDLLESEKSIISLKDKYNCQEIDTFYDIIIFIIKNARKINFIKKSKILSKEKLKVEIIDTYEKYIYI